MLATLRAACMKSWSKFKCCILSGSICTNIFSVFLYSIISKYPESRLSSFLILRCLAFFFSPFCHYITELGKYRALLCVQSVCAGSVTQIPSKDNVIEFITALCECAWHAAQAVETWNLKDAGAKPLKFVGLWGTRWQLLPDTSGSCNYHQIMGHLHGTGRTGSSVALPSPSQTLLPPDIQVKVEENWTINRYCRQ